jgi:glutathione reductase (NADPH)
LKSSNVTMYKGWGKFVDKNVVQVGDDIIEAKNILLATGGHAVVPSIPGAEYPFINTNL